MTLRLVLAILLFFVFLVMWVAGLQHSDDLETQEIETAAKKWKWLVFGFGVFFLLLSTVRVVGAGQVGIPVTLGNTGGQVSSGVVFVNPLATVHTMSVRTEQYTMSVSANEGNKNGDDSVSVLGSDGAQGSVDATILYHLNEGDASRVYKDLGTNFVDKIIRPTARTCIRGGFANYQMVTAATTQRTAVADDIKTCINKTLENDGITLEQFQLRDVHLSKEVQNAIDAKVQAQQRSEQQQFELTKSQQEAEIARVEAQGRADAQQIISCGGHPVKDDKGKITVAPNTGAACQNTLTEAYLQYIYIQAMNKMADSPNHSTLIMPFDQNLTPLINVDGAK